MLVFLVHDYVEFVNYINIKSNIVVYPYCKIKKRSHIFYLTIDYWQSYNGIVVDPKKRWITVGYGCKIATKPSDLN